MAVLHRLRNNPFTEHTAPTGSMGRSAPLAQRCQNLAYKETPVGVEPTSTGRLQPVAVPSGSSVSFK